MTFSATPPIGFPTQSHGHSKKLMNERGLFIDMSARAAVSEPFRRMHINFRVTQLQRIVVYPHDVPANRIALFIEMMYIDIPCALDSEQTSSKAIHHSKLCMIMRALVGVLKSRKELTGQSWGLMFLGTPGNDAPINVGSLRQRHGPGLTLRSPRPPTVIWRQMASATR